MSFVRATEYDGLPFSDFRTSVRNLLNEIAYLISRGVRPLGFEEFHFIRDDEARQIFEEEFEAIQKRTVWGVGHFKPQFKVKNYPQGVLVIVYAQEAYLKAWEEVQASTLSNATKVLLNGTILGYNPVLVTEFVETLCTNKDSEPAA